MANVNVTITLDEKLLYSSKVFAAKRQTSLSGLIREYLSLATGSDNKKDSAKDPETLLRIYSLGQADRKGIMKALGVDYGTLIVMLSSRGLPLPRVPEDEADRMSETFVSLWKG